MRFEHVRRGGDGARVIQAPVDALHDMGPVFDEVGDSREKVVDIVNNRDVLMFPQETVLRSRYIAVAPDVGKGKFLVPPHRTHLAVGKLKAGDHAACQERREKWSDANFVELIIR